MKKSEIQPGKRYTDGKGSVREVLAVGPEYELYPSQEERDNLRYMVIAKKRGPHPIGAERNCTRASFASWAKTEIHKP